MQLDSLLKEMLTCTTCGKCRAFCPSFEEFNWESNSPRGRVMLAYGLTANEIQADISVAERLYACSTCTRCEQNCSSLVKVVEIIETAREKLLDLGLCFDGHRRILENIVRFENPYGEIASYREIFGESPRPDAEVGYFVGCTSAYREQNIARAMLKLLKKLGVNYTLLNENCCGSPLSRIGARSESQKLMEKNIRRIEGLGVKKVVFTCAGCYRMFKLEYPKYFTLRFEALHVTTFLKNFDFRLKPFEQKVTYHDPCHLGRAVGVYDEPRTLIQKVPKLELKELEFRREQAKCCGGGGGLRAGFPELALQIAKKRTSEACGLAPMLLTACPFCVSNLKRTGSEVVIKDVVELLADLI